jgi:predicted  nucleic acid-binding Zn-ribbon protein
MQMLAAKGEMPMELYDAQFKRVDEHFDEVNRRISEGREEAKDRFDRVEGDIQQLKSELKGEMRELKEIALPDLKGELKGDIREVKEEIREVRSGLALVQDSFNRLVLGAATSWVILMVTILVKG